MDKNLTLLIRIFVVIVISVDKFLVKCFVSGILKDKLH